MMTPPLSSTLLCARVTSAAMPYEAFTLVGFPKVNWSWRCKARSPPQKTAMKNTARASWPGLSPSRHTRQRSHGPITYGTSHRCVVQSKSRWCKPWQTNPQFLKLVLGMLEAEVFQPYPSGRKSPGRRRKCWRDFVSQVVWEHL